MRGRLDQTGCISLLAGALLMLCGVGLAAGDRSSAPGGLQLALEQVQCEAETNVRRLQECLARFADLRQRYNGLWRESR